MDDSKDAAKLRELMRKLERRLGILDEQMSCCGVSMTQCHALVEIGRSEQISLNALAEMLNLDNSTMSRTVNNLVNSDLVKRDIDPKDRRCVNISLTDNGTKIFVGIEESMNLCYRNVCSAIPEDKRGQILESMEILLAAFEEHFRC